MLMNRLIPAAILTALMVVPARAEDLTLNDLPRIIDKLRRCETQTARTLGVGPRYETKVCAAPKDMAGAMIEDDGKVSIWYRVPSMRKSYSSGSTIMGTGTTVGEALRALVGKIEADRQDGGEAIKGVGDLLPTQ